ncbi:hypothetical protein [Kineosporia babensis]|uniref:Uncharacterized protein n=1 Tax=Kineosporia babensis TaxID=499548 RepID=A0A9X1SVQ5_9ACTN|nr:hypothetical protein [Kineosporia babensis]MCD5313120.1 hypothetical protein [Kineosporia babensis]
MERQFKAPESILNLYRKALRTRPSFALEEKASVTLDGQVLRIARASGWESLTNFGAEPVDVSARRVAVASRPLLGDQLATSGTVWLEP